MRLHPPALNEVFLLLCIHKMHYYNFKITFYDVQETSMNNSKIKKLNLNNLYTHYLISHKL